MQSLLSALHTANWILCGANLAFYGWGSHDPAHLAVGIFTGLTALYVSRT